MNITHNPVQVLNFQDVRCPLNYVKTKLALEILKIGSIIEVIVDEGEPSRHLPKSIQQDGQKVLDQYKKKDGIHVLIEKVVDY